MDSPAIRYAFDRSLEDDSSSTHTNWEGLIAALGISAIGWASLAILITWLLK